MKLVKFVPAVLSALVVTACASYETAPAAQAQLTEQQPEAVATAQTTNGMTPVKVEKLTNASKVVVYACQNRQTVTASYAFQNNEARAVNLVLGRGKQAQQLPPLTRDEANKDFTSFKSDKYIWNVENGFNFDNATTLVGGMLTEKGEASDRILAKLCDVNTLATRQANAAK